jgi:hypothetical protein
LTRPGFDGRLSLEAHREPLLRRGSTMERQPDASDPGIEDLEASDDEAAEVSGGRMVKSSDPCEGGE